MAKRNVLVSEALPTAMAPQSSVSGTYHPPLVGGASRWRILAPLDLSGGTERRISSWVEAMKASSPTESKVGSAGSLSVAAQSVARQDVWMNRHPSALLKFDEIVAASRGKQIIMFLDYDGTLSPIVDDVDNAFMSDSMRDAVRELARHFPTAIVSGRSRDKVYKLVRLAELYYAGSHGMDIKGPKQKKTKAKSVLFQPANEFLPMINEVYKELVVRMESVPGAKVDNNKFCLSVHYRCVDEKRWSGLAEQVKLLLEQYPKLKLTLGRKVLEIRPTIKWDKGKALEFLLESLGFSECSDVLPFYIGDDRTDEDAFKVLRDRGQGFGILVSKIPKETHASYTLQEPVEVMDFLHQLVDWKRSL